MRLKRTFDVDAVGCLSSSNVQVQVGLSQISHTFYVSHSGTARTPLRFSTESLIFQLFHLL